MNQYEFDRQYQLNSIDTYSINDIQFTSLDGFEKVLGRKFTCKDCTQYNPYKHISNSYLFGCVGNENNIKCEKFWIKDDIKMEIKLKDKEISKTKIDTHPRYLIGSMFNTNKNWEFIKGFDPLFYNEIKLKLIL